MTTTADQLIGRLDSGKRRELLDAAVATTRGRTDVLVEYDYGRRLEDATRLVGNLEGTAYAPGAACVDVLIVNPASEAHRRHALSAAQVLRITLVDTLYPDEATAADPADTFGTRYRLGEVLAGPPRKD